MKLEYEYIFQNFKENRESNIFTWSESIYGLQYEKHFIFAIEYQYKPDGRYGPQPTFCVKIIEFTAGTTLSVKISPLIRYFR